MKRILVAAALVLVVVSPSVGKTIHENSEQAVTETERRWEEALKQFDCDAMQSLLAEDDLQTDFRGLVQDKASWIQDFKQACC